MVTMDEFLHFLEGYGIATKWILAFVGLAFSAYIFINIIDSSSQTFGYIFATAPIWLPFTMFFLFFEAWMDYVHKEFDMKQGRTTIEIKLPQEILKSPLAMELVLNQMHQTAGPDNLVQAYIDGKKPPRYALELVSRGGDVRFYINTPKVKFKNLIETQLYAQYPGIEIHELDIDYSAEVPWKPKENAYFSFHFSLNKADALPIKTYVDYGLDQMPKEEEKIDPITNTLEVLGSLGPNEHMWVQILIDANRKRNFKNGSLTAQADWKEEATKEIKKIIIGAAKRVGITEEGLKEKGSNMNQLLTEAEKDTMKAIERSLGKYAFNTVIRCMYMAKNENYNPADRLSSLTAIWRGYDDLNRNQIGIKWRTDVDWPWWQDPSGSHREHAKYEELKEYKQRAFTSHGASDKPKVMTTEELATIFHFPGKVATTPTLGRIPSKRSEAPSNLPVG